MPALYRPLGDDRFTPTEHCAGPWDERLQHGGPVIGLLAHAMSALGEPGDHRISRITTEILGPVLMDEVQVRSEIVRPGRKIELLSAEMVQGGRPVARATAWRLRTIDTEAVVHHAESPLPPQAGGFNDDLTARGLPASWISGFVAALEWDFVDAGAAQRPTRVWTRLIPDLIEGVPTTPLERVVTTCDVANGVGARLDPRQWSFLNTETTVHLYDVPVGDLVGLSAEASVGRDGIAMSSGLLVSGNGPIGRVTQNSLVEPAA